MTCKVIIHIDDNPSFRQTFRELMSDKGFEVRSYEKSEAASPELADAAKKIVVIDSSGLEFAKSLKVAGTKCRTILLSSNSSDNVTDSDAVVSKVGPWRAELLKWFERFDHEENLARRQRLDLFSDLECCEMLRGRIAVVGGSPEQILQICDNHEQVLAFLSQVTVPCRVVQGPLDESFTMAELLGIK